MIDHTLTEFPEDLPLTTYLNIKGRLTVALADRVSLGWVYWTSGCLRWNGKLPIDQWRSCAEYSRQIAEKLEQTS